MKSLGALPKEDKPLAGKLINQTKAELEAALAERKAELDLKAALPKEPTDFTLPGRRRRLGKLPPLTQVTEDIVRIFRKIGFVVADGPELENEWYCFDALNTPADHPARDTQDTFYLNARQASRLDEASESDQTLNQAGEPFPCFSARTPHRSRSGSWRNNNRPSASSRPAGCIGVTTLTPPTTRLFNKSRDSMWIGA